MKINLAEFTAAYITAALWSSTDESTESGGEPMDKNYSPADIHPDSLEKINADCAKFLAENGIPDYSNGEWSQWQRAGHDFWLTRNNHGCGFWDRDELSEADQTRLTDAAHKCGECLLYVGDDGKLYI